MSPSLELRMNDQDIKQVKMNVIVWSILLVGHIIMMVDAVSQLGFLGIVLRHPDNLAIKVIVMCYAALAILMSSWFLILFAVHVKSAKFLDDVLVIDRFLAPGVRVPYFSMGRKISTAVPSLKEPSYQRGALFISGMSSFFVPDNLQDAHRLVAHLVPAACSPE